MFYLLFKKSGQHVCSLIVRFYNIVYFYHFVNGFLVQSSRLYQFLLPINNDHFVIKLFKGFKIEKTETTCSIMNSKAKKVKELLIMYNYIEI